MKKYLVSWQDANGYHHNGVFYGNTKLDAVKQLRDIQPSTHLVNVEEVE